MDEIILRDIEGRATAAEKQRLARWRQAAPINEQRYQALLHLWKATGVVHGRVHSAPPSPDQIVQRAESRRQAAASREPRRRQTRLLLQGAMAAAFVLLGIALAQLIAITSPDAPILGAARYTTGAGEMGTLQFGDGTVVRLGPNSHLRVSGRSETREVTLEGRAFFAVAKRDGVPFTVRTQLGDAEVLGTRFDIDAQQDQLKVQVLDGRVAVVASGGRAEVEASGVGLVRPAEKPAVSTVEDIYAELGWMGPVLIFRETPLKTVAYELERMYGVRVEVVDPDIQMLPVTAWFGDRSFDEVFTIICRAAGVRCAMQSETMATIAARNTASRVTP